MEVLLLSGGFANLKLRNKRIRCEYQCRSKFQYEIGQELSRKYPHDIIFEEVIVPIDGFILDFFMPSLSLVVECHGIQHTKHVKHFHKTIKQFHAQQIIDEKKREWCDLNDFKLVEIYDE